MNYTINTTSIEATNNGFFNIYPNPADNFIQIEYPFTKGSTARINIYNLTGHLILQQEISGENIRMDVSSLSPGLYFISLHREDVPSEIKRFVKE